MAGETPMAQRAEDVFASYRHAQVIVGGANLSGRALSNTTQTKRHACTLGLPVVRTQRRNLARVAIQRYCEFRRCCKSQRNRSATRTLHSPVAETIERLVPTGMGTLSLGVLVLDYFADQLTIGMWINHRTEKI